MSKDANTIIIERSEFARRCVNRAIVDDHDAHVHVLLGKRAAQSHSEEPPSIAGRYYDRNFRRSVIAIDRHTVHF